MILKNLMNNSTESIVCMFKKHLSHSDFMIDKVFIDRHRLPASRQACLQRAVLEFCDEDGWRRARQKEGERRGNFTGIFYIERCCTNVSNEHLTGPMRLGDSMAS